MTWERQRGSSDQIGAVLWSRVIRRHWSRERGLTLTLIGIIALGVAVFLAVRLANKAAVAGFGLFTESIAGQSDLILRSPSGKLPITILRELRELSGELPTDYFPVLELSGTIERDQGQDLVQLLGADLIALGNVVQSNGVSTAIREARQDSERGVFGALNRVYVGSRFADRYRVREGERLRLWVHNRLAELEIAAILPDPENLPSIPENLVLFDLPSLQRQSGEREFLSRIEIRYPKGALAERIRKEVGDRLSDFAAERNLILETPEDRKSSVTRMSAAFRLNLTILSGLALLVGVYLIMQAMEAAVTKRRNEIAILRSLGVTPGQIRRTWLTEALALGITGSLIGIALGPLLASMMVGGIAATVNTLYYETTTRALSLHPAEALFSLCFGVLASVVAGWFPAREASLTPPAQALRLGETLQKQCRPRWSLGGVLLLCASVASIFLPPLRLPGMITFPLGGYLSALFAVLGSSILLGLGFTPLAKLLASGKCSAMRQYAASRLRAASGRHHLTAAGLSVAIGMSAAMAILVASFEISLTSWIGQILKADLYLSAPGNTSASNTNTISEADWRRLVNLPGIAGADSLQRRVITFRGYEITLSGDEYHGDRERYRQLLWIDPPETKGATILLGDVDGLAQGWISEPFSRRFRVKRGDRITLPTPAGTQEVRVTGIYADYGNEAGTVTISRQHSSQWFDDTGVSDLALYTDANTAPEEVLARIRAEYPSLNARTNERLRSESIRIFHRTFAVTYALEAIAVLIAIVGLALALTGLLLERKRELTTLRAIGATRGQIATAAMWEGTGIALIGLAVGLAVSFFLAWVLIEVINPQSFGWTLRYAVPWSLLLSLSFMTLVTALGVSWTVGYRNANLRSDREE